MSAGAVELQPLDRPAAASRRTVVIIVLLALAAHAIGIWAYRPPHLYDDAMFFLRYSEHIAMGEGFRWNLGEPPIWGASAPLWPVMIAALIRCGLSPEVSALALGWVLSLAGAGALAVAALRCAGIPGAVWCILLESVNSRYGNGVLSGMESSLAMFLVSCGILALSGRSTWWGIGIIAGLAMAEKIDLAPFGVLLMAGAWLKTGRVPWRAGLVAALIAGAWYLFAYLHFGSVVPNSFITKLHAQYGRMPRDWFLIIAFLEGGRSVVTTCAILAVPVLWHRKELLLSTIGLAFVMLAGYTLKPPPEDFGWYQAPVQPAMCFLAGVGLGAAMETLMRRSAMLPWHRALLQGAALVTVGLFSIKEDRPVSRRAYTVMDHTDGDRSLAGKWIDAHTPKDARLLTGYGHIAYHGRRYTYDFTYLNRPGPPKTIDELLAEYRPEIYAQCIFMTGIPPEKYTPPPGYRLVKIFDRTYRDGVYDYYVAIALREGVPVVGGD